MTITFRIRFSTHPGQSLWLAGSHPLPAHPVGMQYVDAEHWEVTVPLAPEAACYKLTYSYVLAHADGSRSMDWGRDRKFIPAGYHCPELLVLDSWNPAGLVENVFYTEPFKQVLFAENVTAAPILTPPNPTHTFRVKAPRLKANQTLCLLGEGAALGHWNTQTPLLLGRPSREDYFSVSLDLRGQPMPLAYKFGMFDLEKGAFVRYEEGANRVLRDEVTEDRYTVVNDGFARLPAEPWRGAGVAIPVFSLRSESSFGVGEFADLKLLADWGKQTGLKLIQLLPINDTSATGTWKDSYPYAATSAFALHPLYMNLAAVANAKNRERLKTLEPERQRLNALDAVDYEAVMRAKLEFLWKIFPSQKNATLRSLEYKSFYTENAHWLVPYAAFCMLRDKFGTADFNQWPAYRQFDAQEIVALVAAGSPPEAEPAVQPGRKKLKHSRTSTKPVSNQSAKLAAATVPDEIAFHYFVQFHLHLQLKDATAHLHAAGLILKGDLAIGVSRNGADAWQSPELYHMDLQAGAPPDAFSAKGQNWGFPTYNWPRMAADGFAWWKRRFAQMGAYFDAFRIDHILGFFRIWSSPAHAVEGILGHFEPALPLEPADFSARGIPFDRERMLQPFITNAVLEEIFGSDTEVVRREFLLPSSGERYGLKPEFATQRQVEDFFASDCARIQATDSEEISRVLTNTATKQGLFDLISNVILLEAGGKLHFRFAMEQTSSFMNLPAETQSRLRDLYVDYFFRRQDDFWRREALQKLPALKRVTDMLICGEDLGLVPACVPEVMRELGFLSLEIQRMPKALGQEFSRPADAPYLSVVTPATHDMSTIRGWWEEDGALTQRFFNHVLGLPGEAPKTAEPWIVQSVVRQHLASPAMWSIFQWQDLLGMDGGLRRENVAVERINVPGTPNFYWRYRQHLTLEKLLQADEFNSQLRQMLTESGR
jgi:4-alpha-glucanotransferase